MIPNARGKMNNVNSSSAQLDAHKSNLFVNKYLPSKLLHFPRIKRHSFTVLPLFAVQLQYLHDVIAFTYHSNQLLCATVRRAFPLTFARVNTCR